MDNRKRIDAFLLMGEVRQTERTEHSSLPKFLEPQVIHA